MREGLLRVSSYQFSSSAWRSRSQFCLKPCVPVHTQLVWDEIYPFADKKALKAARLVGFREHPKVRCCGWDEVQEELWMGRGWLNVGAHADSL